jgi:hypothetical protein
VRKAKAFLRIICCIPRRCFCFIIDLDAVIIAELDPFFQDYVAFPFSYVVHFF